MKAIDGTLLVIETWYRMATLATGTTMVYPAEPNDPGATSLITEWVIPLNWFKLQYTNDAEFWQIGFSDWIVGWNLDCPLNRQNIEKLPAQIGLLLRNQLTEKLGSIEKFIAGG